MLANNSKASLCAWNEQVMHALHEMILNYAMSYELNPKTAKREVDLLLTRLSSSVLTG